MFASLLLDVLRAHPFSIAFTLFLAHFVSDFVCLVVRQRFSLLNRLRGPPATSWITGNLSELSEQENNGILQHWEETYGSTYVYRGFLGGRRLCSTDPVVISHILAHAYDYPKPDFVRDSLSSMTAGHQGLLCTEGDQHRKQRKILAPAFTAAHVKSLAPIFWQKATQLRDIWLSKSTAQPNERVDVLSWLSRATLDVIGLAGFGYMFDALNSEEDELAKAFSDIFSASRKFRMITVLQAWFPFLRRFRRQSATEAQATAIMRRIGLQLVKERTDQVCYEKQDKDNFEQAVSGRDLLSVLIRSNLLATSSDKSMNEEEILSQISTFMVAGHETTASALSWCLYALCKHPSVQDKLREELALLSPLDDDNERSVIDSLNSCQYLEWVVRETLRLFSPATNTMRVCKRAKDEIPVGPAGYTDRWGVRHEKIMVSKGDIFSIPIQAINKSKDLWGEDALLFRPERWESPPDSSRAIPGLYAHSMAFLNNNGNMISGNRSCIGWKFALLEIKIFLYVLLRSVKFTIDPTMVIEKKLNVVIRPFVKNEPELENQMPLYLERV